MPGRRRPSALVELLVVLATLGVFVVLHARAGHDVAAATAHARTLQSLERGLHLDVERETNAWLVHVATPLQVLAVYVYRSYYLVVVGVLLWVYLRHQEVYRHVRRTLVAMLLLVLPVYWAVPMSPPRFALAGVVDVVALHDPGHVRGWTVVDNLTAMPSLHVALAAWCAYAAWSALRTSHPRPALLVWLFPLLMTGVVLGTGNHYVLDVVGSAVLLTASALVARAWGRFVRREPRETGLDAEQRPRAAMPARP